MLLCSVTLAAPAAPVRFKALDIYVDSGAAAVAAWQIEVKAPAGRAAIVGVEGSNHAAWRDPAYYDPAALAGNRIILAAFSTAKDLPKGEILVARLHFQITGEGDPEITATLQAAGSPAGNPIKATVRTEWKGMK